jgi:hypothetical protein
MDLTQSEISCILFYRTLKQEPDNGTELKMQNGVCVLAKKLGQNISVSIYALLFARHGRRATVRKWRAIHQAHLNAQTVQPPAPRYSRADYLTLAELLRIEQQKPVEHVK